MVVLGNQHKNFFWLVKNFCVTKRMQVFRVVRETNLFMASLYTGHEGRADRVLH